MQAIWDALTSALTTVGSIGKKLADWSIGTAQTGDAYARLGAPAGASVSADVAAINAKTTNLPASPASTTNITAATGITVATNSDKTGYSLSTAPLDAAATRSAVGLASANLDTQLGAIAGYIDTEVGAIKAKTDNLPASPAATGDAMTLTVAYAAAKTASQAGDAMTLTSGERTSIGTAVWATTVRSLSTFGTLVADITTAVWAAASRTLSAFSFTVDTNANATETAIKTKTDSLTFTVAGQVDANVTSVNDTEVVGTGSSGDEWGPA